MVSSRYVHDILEHHIKLQGSFDASAISQSDEDMSDASSSSNCKVLFTLKVVAQRTAIRVGQDENMTQRRELQLSSSCCQKLLLADAEEAVI
ncbi:hypothetical protein Leryth_023880 [Lithospermum erythrorhizon]|nr:hypothetical protein Leryth_023880 [Lithospermum erythrorhizon]